jgi:adenosylhomocysteine nucleosidase
VLAVVAAMREELAALLSVLERPAPPRTLAGRRLHAGRLAGMDAVLTLAGIGKVAAAATTAIVLGRLEVDAVLVVGTAGGLGDGVGAGDVVVARELLQHDLDASPLFPRWEVPLTGRSRFAADPRMAATAAAAARDVLREPPPALAGLGLGPPAVHEGLVVSGDTFVADAASGAALRRDLPEALAVEMEGAAVAQVCADFGRPFAVVRTVSDRADDAAGLDFERFLAGVAAEYARDIVLATLARL